MSGAVVIACAGVLWAVIGTLLTIPFLAESAAGTVSPELATGAVWMRATALAGGIATLALAGVWHRFPAPSRPAATTAPSGALAGGWQLALLIVVAAGVRVIRLDAGLWYDEIVTLVEFVRLTPSELMTSYKITNNHILYSLLAHASVGTFGEHAWAVRLPAAGLGVASLAALWWMAHELAPAREARLATWLVALSYHHVWFSQNARGYTGIFLFSWLGTALYLRARRGPVGSARGLWLAYAALLAAGLYIHLSAIFVFFAHGLVYLGDEASRAWSRRRSTARGADAAAGATPDGFDGWPLVGFGFGLLAAFQLYAILLPQLVATFAKQSGDASGSAEVSEWKNPLWTVVEIVGSLQLGAASLLAATVALTLATAGFVSIARRNPAHAALMALPTPITLAVLLIVNFNIWPRYFLVSLGFASIIAMRGVFVTCAALAAPAAAPGWLRDRPRELATAACVAMVVLSSVTVLHNYRFPKQDYPGARDFAAEQAAPGEPVLAAGLASYSYSTYYAPDLGVLEDAAELDALRASSPDSPVWLIYSFSMHLRSTMPEIWERIERDFEVVRSFPGTLGDGTIHVLRSAPAASAERSQPGSVDTRIAAREKPETA